ncbi:D-alanyl-D-alanine endopeptidase precursor [Actinomadura rubteroloni]|uniref:D-alanyl-D-alanine endopeptidase n=1 Tax=Actinomadura rubteroloni TaxID=1926885 RepID=A0A2P4UPS4_9ACTN|nr:D-alanyl-D-alanine carboxypeptidase [Actinomadura rubteroloni]POM27055.1 D-alanyl-D-alanine endopeptidase precursor [Actinomadura rubteroloni]
MTRLHGRRRWALAAAACLAMAILAALVGVAAGTMERPSGTATVAGLPWPRGARGALQVEGAADPVVYGSRKPVPIASVAKLMTAYVFLRSRPLEPGRSGPVFTISAAEAGRYGERLARQESVVPVRAGQEYTEREALEGLLTVSANNLAHEIARWDAGGERAFVAKMNAAARALGMRDTRYTDPSGFDSGTVSTASDQLLLLRAVSRLPGFLAVASQPWFEAPGTVGRIPTTDPVLGTGGVLAGKTGYTSAAGGNFAFVALTRRNNVPVLVRGVILGHHDVPNAAATCRFVPALVSAAVAGPLRRTAEADRVQAWADDPA